MRQVNEAEGTTVVEASLLASRIAPNIFDANLKHDATGSDLTLSNGQSVRATIGENSSPSQLPPTPPVNTPTATEPNHCFHLTSRALYFSPRPPLHLTPSPGPLQALQPDAHLSPSPLLPLHPPTYLLARSGGRHGV